MTSEVCLMNRLSVVLAADSASTVEYYGERGAERRYFKGANKIFQLSNEHPVGLMIYQSASLLGVPWEVTIKEFRKQLENRSFNTVKGFAEEFIEYIQENQRFFPDAIRRQALVEEVGSSCFRLLIEAREALGHSSSPEILDHMLSVGVDLSAAPLTTEETEDLWAQNVPEIEAAIAYLGPVLDNPPPDAMSKLARLAFELALVGYSVDNGYSGLVFAGFGEHSVFPELVSYGEARFVGTKFIVGHANERQVTHSIPAVLDVFAQRSMADTFRMGLSQGIYEELQKIMGEEMKQLADEVAALSPGAPDETKRVQMVRERIESSNQKLFSHMEAEHQQPLRRVLGVLPVDEMADLAETLVNLQSLKEKVTKTSETVGGPVDVAVITRAEGLVWIKRKHYFQPELNSRFFERRHR